jgi:hypothetical protein
MSLQPALACAAVTATMRADTRSYGKYPRRILFMWNRIAAPPEPRSLIVNIITTNLITLLLNHAV